jgi:hypothetical protein
MNAFKARGLAFLVALCLGGSGCTSDTTNQSSATTSPTPTGSITVALAEEAGQHPGDHVAAVLITGWPGTDPTGVAGFQTTVPADPSTQAMVLGNGLRGMASR